jgi:hypothetical protein
MSTVWRKKKPCKPGYYWFYGFYMPSLLKTGKPQIVWVNKEGTVFLFGGKMLSPQQLEGQWDGPIKEPKERRP